MRERLLRVIKSISLGLLVSAGMLALVEGALRVGLGMPRGLFNFTLSGVDGLYPPNTTLTLSYGAVPYTIKTNALGLRGAPVSVEKAPGVIRIAAVGDSITDGFFVDNDVTYPALLESALRAAGQKVEVINAARGGGSIDKEYALLTGHVLPLRPDIVVLTFVCNDISDLRNRSRAELLAFSLRLPLQNVVLAWCLSRTAIGELLGSAYLRGRVGNRPSGGDLPAGDDRYRIRGAMDNRSNVEIFNRRFRITDGLISREPWSEETQELLGNYVFVLGHVVRRCRENGIRFTFVYFPSYPQVYDLRSSMRIRDELQRTCVEMGVPFVDLTGPLREAGRDRALHLAPVDFHLNPDGNRVIAGAVAKALLDEDLFSAK